jgi:hypothetical protein
LQCAARFCFLGHGPASRFVVGETLAQKKDS